ncbi:MAG: TRAP transporter small permease, partial [Desulfovibrio sp.]|nr:TRAP transporter small permease [Desulfovibrio sp.]
WVVFLSLPLVAKKGGHMCIDTITSRVHGPVLKTHNILADLFSQAFLSIMVFYGIRMVSLTSFQTSPAMMIPMSWVYIVIPFGCAVMWCYVLGNLIKVIKTPSTMLSKGGQA